MLIVLRHIKVSWATWGDCDRKVRGKSLTALYYGRIAKMFSQYPTEGTFILSFCDSVYKERINKNEKNT